MKTDLLLKLADYLDTVPVEKFDMKYWDCGTTACAVGHAATIPEFKELGLRLEPNLGPCYKTSYGWEAVRRFFEITTKEAEFLFQINDVMFETPTWVASKIREFVKQRGVTAEVAKDIRDLIGREQSCDVPDAKVER